jgi:PAS domain S-box-containing protein
MGVRRTREATALEVPGLLSAIVEGTPDAVFVKDLDGRYLLVNSACTRILGRPKEEIVGRSDAQILPPEAAARLAEVDRLVMDTGEASSYEEVLPVAGRPRTYLSTKSVHRDAAGNALGIIGISRDITERKLAEEERARLAAIVRSSEDAIFGKTLDGTITSWNPGAEKIYGYPAEEAVGRPVSMLAPPEVSDEIPAILEKVRRGEVVAEHETVRLTKGGRRIDVSLTVSPIKDSAGKVVGASTIARDVTERKRAEEAAIEVREAERGRLARDLHDGVLQDLSVVVQRLEVRRVASEMEGSDAGLDQEIDALRRAVRGLREAVYDLRPGEEAPFLDRMEQMVRHYRDLTPERDIALAVEEGFPLDLPEGAATHLLRLVREALTNARQHSAARRVSVCLGATEGGLSVEVADDGRGFAAGEAGWGIGLSTMRERAALLGGDLEVRSEPGEGTRVRLRLARPATP